MDSDRYTIDAKSEDPQSPEIMRGPMLQGFSKTDFI